jgi:pimeloyl-ACP methyl ester carboxylesterase
MNQYSHQTAPTQFVEANGIRFAYRRFGKAGGVPIVFNQHYTGTMDYWDPALTDGLARDRGVILFNNAGVSSSSGEVPTTFEQMSVDSSWSPIEQLPILRCSAPTRSDEVTHGPNCAGRDVAENRGCFRAGHLDRNCRRCAPDWAGAGGAPDHEASSAYCSRKASAC